MSLSLRCAALLTGAVSIALIDLAAGSHVLFAQAVGRLPIGIPGAPFQPTTAPFLPMTAPFQPSGAPNQNQNNFGPPAPPPGAIGGFAPGFGMPFGNDYGGYGFGNGYANGGYGYGNGGYGMVQPYSRPRWGRDSGRWNNVGRPMMTLPTNQVPVSRQPAPPRPPFGVTSTLLPSPQMPNNNVNMPPVNEITNDGAGFLGGYYFGNYTDTWEGYGTYPTVYSDYSGFPSYFYDSSPGVVIYSPTSLPEYYAAPQPFTPPVYSITYNQNNYYVRTPNHAARINADLSQGTAKARVAVKTAYPADSFQATFADIERAWNAGDVSLLKEHLRTDGSKISVFLNGKYKYSLNAADFAQITRDAFDRLDTVSFKFTELQKAKNGDLTAYGTHVYRLSGGTGNGAVVPFDADAAPTSTADEKTVYVSYTLRHGDNGWYVTAIDSSTKPLVHPAS